MPSRSVVRAIFVGLLVISSFVVVGGYLTSAASPGEKPEFTFGDRTAPPRENITVITTDSNAWLGGSPGEGPKATAEIVAYRPNGSVLYYNDSHTRYWDVDPVPGTSATVEYVAADHLDASECGGEVACTRNVVERVNLTTGETTRIYSRITPRKHATRWHDVDRIDDTRIAVADIDQDRVFVVNTSSEIVTWSWDAQTDYSVTDSGGPYPSDWTHLNDIEVLEDGQLMVSLRNHDQVVFLDPQTGLVENRTLGSENEYETLYEQHNPDYIPRERGGPAVVVADSENNRIIEYQRSGDEWERTWSWRDARMQWPRDADRLPDGNTLVTDSNGGRVFEVAPNGSIVWSVDVAFPYESERLGTGDESAGGQSARAAELQSRGGDTGASGTNGEPSEGSENGEGWLDRGWSWIKDTFGGPELNAVAYALPTWVGPAQVAALVAIVVGLVSWGIIEWRWSAWSIQIRSPFLVHRPDREGVGRESRNESD